MTLYCVLLQFLLQSLSCTKKMSEATGDDYKHQIKHTSRTLLFDDQICVVANQRMTAKGALVKVGYFQEEINNKRYCHAVDRAKKKIAVISWYFCCRVSTAVGEYCVA